MMKISCPDWMTQDQAFFLMFTADESHLRIQLSADVQPGEYSLYGSGRRYTVKVLVAARAGETLRLMAHRRAA